MSSLDVLVCCVLDCNERECATVKAISFYDLLTKVFDESSSRMSFSRDTLLVSCEVRYYLPLLLSLKGRRTCESVDLRLRECSYTLCDVSVKSVDLVDGGVYLVLNVGNYVSDVDMSYEQTIERFPTQTTVDYADFVRYERVFQFYGYVFEVKEDLSVVVVAHN